MPRTRTKPLRFHHSKLSFFLFKLVICGVSTSIHFSDAKWNWKKFKWPGTHKRFVGAQTAWGDKAEDTKRSRGGRGRSDKPSASALEPSAVGPLLRHYSPSPHFLDFPSSHLLSVSLSLPASLSLSPLSLSSLLTPPPLSTLPPVITPSPSPFPFRINVPSAENTDLSSLLSLSASNTFSRATIFSLYKLHTFSVAVKSSLYTTPSPQLSHLLSTSYTISKLHNLQATQSPELWNLPSTSYTFPRVIKSLYSLYTFPRVIKYLYNLYTFPRVIKSSL